MVVLSGKQNRLTRANRASYMFGERNPAIYVAEDGPVQSDAYPGEGSVQAGYGHYYYRKLFLLDKSNASRLNTVIVFRGSISERVSNLRRSARR